MAETDIKSREEKIEYGPWNEYLIQTFLESRDMPTWKIIYEAHDGEDRDYFRMLESWYEMGFLKKFTNKP